MASHKVLGLHCLKRCRLMLLASHWRQRSPTTTCRSLPTYLRSGSSIWKRPRRLSRFGQKGIGESGAIGPPAAIANAANDALRSIGAELTELPLHTGARAGRHRDGGSKAGHVMKAAPFDYLIGDDVPNTARRLTADDGGTKAVAGAQSLGPMLNLRLVRPAQLIDVSLLPALRETSETTAAVQLGAAVTHAEIEDGEVPDPTPGWLREAAANIAHRAVRNRGTLGGSLAHADPAADWVIVMTGLNATVVLEGPDGRREVAMSDFITGPFETALTPGELIVAVSVPRRARNRVLGLL